jgi:hypothetical protein
VDEPRPLTGGGRVAAPVFAGIGTEVSRYMGLDRKGAVQQVHIAQALP